MTLRLSSLRKWICSNPRTQCAPSEKSAQENKLEKSKKSWICHYWSDHRCLFQQRAVKTMQISQFKWSAPRPLLMVCGSAQITTYLLLTGDITIIQTCVIYNQQILKLSSLTRDCCCFPVSEKLSLVAGIICVSVNIIAIHLTFAFLRIQWQQGWYRMVSTTGTNTLTGP